MYQEPLIIPMQLALDMRISAMAKFVFAFMAKYQREKLEVFNRDICQILEIDLRHLKRLKAELAKFGYLSKLTDSRGGIKYVLLDPAQNTFEKLKKFLAASKIFGSITARDLLTMHPDPDKTLYTMEVLEYTYRKSDKTVEHPERLLRSRLKTGVKPERGFIRDWWLIEQQRIGESAAEHRERLKKEAEERERQLQEEKAFEKYLASLTKKQLEVFKDHAIAKLKANGGIPKIGGEMTIKLEMKKIWREGSQCQKST